MKFKQRHSGISLKNWESKWIVPLKNMFTYISLRLHSYQ